MPQPELVIVTGAAGFIGSHLCRALLAGGFRVLGIDNFDPFYDRSLKMRNVEALNRAAHSNHPQAGFDLVEADICNRKAVDEIFCMRRPTSIFHLAALAGVRPSIEAPARYASVNVDGLVSVLDAARRCECRRIAFASSSSVYGNNAKTPFAEIDPVDEPISPYAATKRAGELICHTYAHLFGMRIAALRFFTVYGPAQRPDLAISKFINLISAGHEVPMFGDGSTSRDYTYIEDIIHGVLAAHRHLEKQPEGFFRIYNFGSDHPITLAELIQSIARVVGKPARIKSLPRQPGDVERTWADVSRARVELGYAPRTPFHEGLQQQWRHVANLSGGPHSETALTS